MKRKKAWEIGMMKRSRRFKITSFTTRNDESCYALPTTCHSTAYVLIAVLLATLFGVYGSAWSEETAAKQKKQYPDPHRIHLEARSESSADFLVGEIADWPGFVHSLQGKAQLLQLGPETKLIIGMLKPEGNGDDKANAINILNRQLLEKNLASRAKGAGPTGSETAKLQQTYKKTGDIAELKWLNRSILCDIFPQITRKKRSAELKKITCATCHEAWGSKAWGQLDNAARKDPAKEAVNEGEVTACISMAIVGKKTVEECVEMIKEARRSRIEPYGPLKNIMQKTDTKGETPMLAAVHPEDPYTFKPLLKRLVCLECHSRKRTVDKVMGSDGKVKKIKLFYGAGVETNR